MSPDPSMGMGNVEGEGVAHCKVYGILTTCGSDAAFCQITVITCCFYNGAVDADEKKTHECGACGVWCNTRGTCVADLNTIVSLIGNCSLGTESFGTGLHNASAIPRNLKKNIILTYAGSTTALALVVRHHNGHRVFQQYSRSIDGDL